jgi:hydroxypyruvate reductase
MFDAAVASAQPSLAIPKFLPDLSTVKGRVLVIGAGKASAAMAQAVEAHWRGRGLERVTGLVVTRYGYGAACERIEIVEAAHPVPDAAGEAAARRLLEFVKGPAVAGPSQGGSAPSGGSDRRERGGLSSDDLVVCLISGGGSALLPLAAPGLSLADKQAINRALLASGATITEMNCLRRHLSAIKGGRLAAACHPARVLTLLISDVPGDRPIDIASGPTVADPTTCDDALAIVRRFGIALPPAARELLESGRGESPKPGDPRLANAQTHIIAAPQIALDAAAEVARQAGYAAYVLGDSIEGEARDVGKVLAGIALQVAERGQPFTPPCVLLSGGETTVTIRGKGRGGRNVECLLSTAITLDGHARVWGMAGDTDGVDGAEDIAGAMIDPTTLPRAWAAGLRPKDQLADNNGHGFFQALGDSVDTGPTRTNVNDFRALLIEAAPGGGSVPR